MADLMLFDDVQEGLLHRARHVGRVSTDVEVCTPLQQAPHQLTRLPQPVLHVHLLCLPRHDNPVLLYNCQQQ